MSDKSPWLRHLEPDSSDNPADDMAMFAIENGLCNIIHLLEKTGQFTQDEAIAHGTNTMMSKMLATQRQHSPNGQAAMVTVLFFEDPLMEPLRTKLVKAFGDSAEQLRRHAFWRGLGLGVAIGSLLGLLMLTLR